MTKRIIHYYSPSSAQQEVEVPYGTKILCAEWRSRGPALYVEKPTGEAERWVTLSFAMCPTGAEFETDLDYVGSASDGLYVFHVYAKIGD
jgi:hypothetical protein